MPLIYIVDDEPNIRQLAALAMRDAAMECETFANGEELMQAINWRIPDAVILDWMMPVMDGLEVIKLRSDKKTSYNPNNYVNRKDR